MALAASGDVAHRDCSPEVTYHKIPMQGLREPMRLAQLTDFHRSWCVSEYFLSQVAQKTNRLKPDCVLLTGDFVTRSTDYMPSCLISLAQLHAPLGLYGVLGNHDYTSDNQKGGPLIVEALHSIDVEVLTNRSVRLENGLRLVGVDDFSKGRPDPDAAFSGVRPGEAAIAMTHNPLLFPQMCKHDCITLAGHTHGGQIFLPFLTRTTFQRLARYLRGWYSDPEGPGRLYVSRGLGVVGIPLRIRCHPEISVFDLHPV